MMCSNCSRLTVLGSLTVVVIVNYALLVDKVHKSLCI